MYWFLELRTIIPKKASESPHYSKKNLKNDVLEKIMRKKTSDYLSKIVISLSRHILGRLILEI